ncbi:MAG: hypothetical protein E6I38_01810 [Chloroflexi bacterium]|nr:MAG: hypothetical protein E6I38_01810 [Chloroflexota bacterium]
MGASAQSRRAGGTFQLAPELPGAEELQQSALEDWITVAVGHTDATYEEARRAFGDGASHVTHAYNGMRPFHHRDPGPVLAAIDSPHVTLELIADGVHLHPATVRAIVRAAGSDRIALVSDAVPPAGSDGGVFRVGDQDARLTGDRVLLPDGTIAGGAATMGGIVRNVVEGLSDRKGRLAAGFDADLVALDNNLNVAMTWAGGRLVFAVAEHFN